jgi:hypothetical protein
VTGGVPDQSGNGGRRMHGVNGQVRMRKRRRKARGADRVGRAEFCQLAGLDR